MILREAQNYKNYKEFFSYFELLGVTMQLTFLGTGTAAPLFGRRPSSILLKKGDFTGLLDIGSGAVHSLAATNVDPINLNALFISHFHSDHSADMIMLLHSNSATPEKIRTAPLKIYGPQGLRTFVDGILKLFPETEPETYFLDLKENPQNEKIISNMKVDCFRTEHTVNSIGYRFRINEFDFVYTGDCAFSMELIRSCTGADMMITECSYADRKATADHLTPAYAAELAKKAGVKDLIIIHRYPQTLEEDVEHEISSIYSGNLFFPQDGQMISFGE